MDLNFRSFGRPLLTTYRDAETPWAGNSGIPACIDLYEGESSPKTMRRFVMMPASYSSGKAVRWILNSTNAMAAYDTGTIEINLDEVTVTGTGTTWDVDFAYQARLRYDTDGSQTWSSWAQIASRSGDTAIVLSNGHGAGAIAAGTDYQIEHLDLSLFDITNSGSGDDTPAYYAPIDVPQPILATPQQRYLHVCAAETGTFNLFLWQS